jgi:hypothetical protein
VGRAQVMESGSQGSKTRGRENISYLKLIQRVPRKTGPAARRNQERILFLLVSGTLNAHSFTEDVGKVTGLSIK